MMLSRAPGFSSMLKDGARNYEGPEDVIHPNIEACIELSRLFTSSFGPCGSSKFILNHLGKLFTTSDAATIVNEIEVQHPAVKILSMACQQQDKEVGDGTNFVILFGCELLHKASTNLLRMGLTARQIQEGYEVAMTHCLSELERIADDYKVNDIFNPSQIEQYLAHVISSKFLGNERILSALVTEACIGTFDNGFNVDNVRVCKIKGSSIQSSFIIKGIMLKSDVESVCRNLDNAPVAVYSCPVDIATLETKGTVLLQNASELLSFSKGEESGLRSIIKSIYDTGVRLIVSGSKFSDLALHFINELGMMAIRVMSKFDLRRIAKSSGAFVLPRLQAPQKHEIGNCQNVRAEEIGGTVVIRMNTLQSKIMTIVLRASTDQMLDDMERAINDAVNVYKAFTKDSRLLPGCCATEIHLAKHLINIATTSEQAGGDAYSGINRFAMQAFGEAFEAPIRTLVDNGGLNGTETLAKLYCSDKFTGVNLPDGDLINVVETNQMDNYLVKLNAIKLAFQAVNSILSVDQIIMAKQAGGPKPKENKHWDDE